MAGLEDLVRRFFDDDAAPAGVVFWTLSTADDERVFVGVDVADTRGMDDVDAAELLGETERDRVVSWRELQLLRLEWFEPGRARAIAETLTVDLHELRRLVGLGATPEQAATIAEAELP